jgi:quaternary ammonium compound-resistance protein SugE
MRLSWFILIAAGLLEIVWAITLKQTEGFTRLVPSVITIGTMAASFYLLSIAMRTLPLGTAYAVWVGIGAIGTAIAGIVVFQEAATPLKLVSMVLVVAGIVGLRVAAV